MHRLFYVMSSAGWPYVDDDGDPITYNTEVKAIAAAEQLAQDDPGNTYYVAKPIRASKCEVSKPFTSLVA